MKYFLLLAALSLVACTDATSSKYTTLGNDQFIQCFSGGKIIYEGESTGKIINEEGSDGYYFRDKANGKLVEVSADCVFKQK